MKGTLGFFICLILLTLNTCGQKKSTVYEFFDGSGNGYSFSKDSIFYDPVTPEHSSSGIYSGGEKASTSITVKEFKQLKKNFNSLVKNSSIHLDNRIMTSGLLRIKEGDQINSSTIIRSGDELDAIQKQLDKALHKE